MRLKRLTVTTFLIADIRKNTVEKSYFLKAIFLTKRNLCCDYWAVSKL